MAPCGGFAGSVGRGDSLIVFVPGVSGDGAWYGGLKRGIVETRNGVRVESFNWGAPLPLFSLNFNNQSIHEDAERKLAVRSTLRLHSTDPDRRIDIVAHSAGCGVTLGALAQINSNDAVGDIILLAPSVSPAYDLAPAVSNMRELARVSQRSRHVVSRVADEQVWHLRQRQDQGRGESRV